MPVLALDLGGTKLATAVFTEEGTILREKRMALAGRGGAELGTLIASQVKEVFSEQQSKGKEISAIGICVPGISDREKGTVWAPNIPGWEHYPLYEEIQKVAAGVPVAIESDRSCYILGESWKGAAQGCTDAIFLAVGTGIGAGILANGAILRGARGVSGAIGWMALERPFQESYQPCGCFESKASGEGMAKLARVLLSEQHGYKGPLMSKPLQQISSYDVFDAYEANDPVARQVIGECIVLWGMAIANLVSLFNPPKIILGGGVFGPAVKFIPAICAEARKWAQPVSMQQVSIEASALGSQAGLYGAGLLALQNR